MTTPTSVWADCTFASGVTVAECTSFARPKSRSFGRPDGVTMTLCGFRSRWTMPRRCARARASATCAPSASASRTGRGPRRSTAGQRLAFDILHHDEGAAVVGLAHLVHGADIRMIQRGRGLGFAQQVPAGVVVIAAVGRQELDRDVALERQVAGQVHVAHTAAPQQTDDAVVPQFRAGFARGHRGAPLLVTGGNSGQSIHGPSGRQGGPRSPAEGNPA